MPQATDSKSAMENLDFTLGTPFCAPNAPVHRTQDVFAKDPERKSTLEPWPPLSVWVRVKRAVRPLIGIANGQTTLGEVGLLKDLDVLALGP